jgi:hypothetical protein
MRFTILGIEFGVFFGEYYPPYTLTTQATKTRDLLAFCCGGIRGKRYTDRLESYDFNTEEGLLHFAFLIGLQDTLRIQKIQDKYRFESILDICRYFNKYTDQPF